MELTKEEKKIVEDFIRETPEYIASFGNAFNSCPVCGAIPENMDVLLRVIKKLYKK